MIKKQYIGYYRVSTKRQGDSGLSLESQKQDVQRFVPNDGTLINEYTEVESGRKNNRKQLSKALQECRDTGATLVIAKLDRLSRNAPFTIMLRDSSVDFLCADMPEANSLTIGILALIAQDEADKISRRVKDALSVIKGKIERGEEHISKSGNVITKLGAWSTMSDFARERGLQIRKENAKNNPESKKAGAFIVTAKNAGNNFSQITKMLNNSGFSTPRGGKFSQVQTKRLYERYK